MIFLLRIVEILTYLIQYLAESLLKEIIPYMRKKFLKCYIKFKIDLIQFYIVIFIFTAIFGFEKRGLKILDILIA